MQITQQERRRSKRQEKNSHGVKGSAIKRHLKSTEFPGQKCDKFGKGLHTTGKVSPVSESMSRKCTISKKDIGSMSVKTKESELAQEKLRDTYFLGGSVAKDSIHG